MSHKDIVTPLQIDADMKVASNSKESMCTICPVASLYNVQTVSTTAHFALGCEKGHICHPNLKLSANAEFKGQDKAFLIDTSPYFDLVMDVSNTGEVIL